jgi:hypothetical protein
MDNFVDQTEFWYEKGGDNKRDDDKWWMPTVKVPSEGLSDVTRKWLQYQKECVNQVLKAAMAINAQVLVEMEIPEIYIESLPKAKRQISFSSPDIISVDRSPAHANQRM